VPPEREKPNDGTLLKHPSARNWYTQAMWIPYIATTVAVIIMAVVGMKATDIGEWYKSLKKPAWQPPDWLFGPAWTTLYCLIVASVGLVWNAASANDYSAILWLVGINFVLNMLWSVLFFTLKRPLWALVEAIMLMVSVAAMMFFFYPILPLAAWLLLPYLAWVAFAAFLTFTILRLNPSIRGL